MTHLVELRLLLQHVAHKIEGARVGAGGKVRGRRSLREHGTADQCDRDAIQKSVMLIH